MKPFHTIAIPHQDILQGKLTMEIFAADLWETYHNRGPVEYKDPETFFQKTYLTEGLQNLLNIIQKRVEGKGGDPTIQIQTPFGGGKTHSLIAILHKAKEWKAKTVVIAGTNLSANNTLWGILEEQLTGKIEHLSGLTAPGKEKLKLLLQANQPLVILMDEVLQYVTKAAGVKVGESTLAAQTMAFMQELSEAVSILDKTCLVVTLPSSIIEHYDKASENLYMQLQRIIGRVERIYTPVQEKEIAKVIRCRLFSSVDVDEAKKIIKKFVDYAQKEGILPPGVEPSEYRDRFVDSYPFLPEVIDILYHRWGSFPTFQRTRGVLRLLSLVVSELKNQNIPYITLADFNLANLEIRQELIKYIGTEYNSVIAQDITDSDAGGRKEDKNVGDAYCGLKLATRAATTIFMYSHSGGTEKGATLLEIKRSATTLNIPSSIVAEILERLKGRLFYFQAQGDKYYFSNQPNINRIVLIKMENVRDEELVSLEKKLLEENIRSDKFKVFLWEENSSSIPDTEELKLVILNAFKKPVIESILKNKGSTPRVNCNTVFFLYTHENERGNFLQQLRRYKAYQIIENDKTIPLSDDQRKEIKNELKRLDVELKEMLRKTYRYIALPSKEGYTQDDLGIPTYGEQDSITQKIYNHLRNSQKIVEKIVPLVIKEKYLSSKDYVSTWQILHSAYCSPGEMRFSNKSVLEQAIKEGVEKGIFGLGDLKDGEPVCRYFKQIPSVGFSESEIIIKEELCKEQTEEPQVVLKVAESPEPEPTPQATPLPSQPTPSCDEITSIHIPPVEIPRGKVNDVMRIIQYLQTQFVKIKVSIDATDGKISKQDYENKVKEGFKQLGIDIP